MNVIFLLVASLFSQVYYAQKIEELPLFVRFKEMPLEENPVGGYATFGIFSDGLPAIEVISPNVVSFFERNKILRAFPYNRNQINCKLGLITTVAMGGANEIRNLPTIKGSVPIDLIKTHPLTIQFMKEFAVQVALKLIYDNMEKFRQRAGLKIISRCRASFAVIRH